MPRHFIDVPDLSQEELKEVLAKAHVIDDQYEDKIPFEGTHLLDGRAVGFVNAMESARTGGSIVAATAFHRGIVKEFGKEAHKTETGGVRESPLDLLKTAIALHCRFVLGRVPNQQDLVDAARFADENNASIINSLTKGKAHPTQAVADMYGFLKAFKKRKMEIKRPKLVFAGRGDNNVTISQAKAAAMLGFHWVHTGPKDDFRIPAEEMEGIEQLAKRYGGTVEFEANPQKAVQGAHGVYGDVFLSMGDKDDQDLKERVHAKLPPYQINAALMAAAAPGAVYGHCLPRTMDKSGITEVTDDVHDGPQSIIYEIVNGRTVTLAALMELFLEEN